MKLKDMVLLWDHDIVRLEKLENGLKKQGMESKEIDTYSELIEIIRSEEHLVVFSLELFQEQGFENWKDELYRICHNYYGIFCVFGEESANEADVIRAGVVDYITKEENTDVTIQKLVNWSGFTRKEAGGKETALQDYLINEETRVFEQGGRSICFSPLEFHLLQVLIRGDGTYQKREWLYNEVWKGRNTKNMRVVDTTIKQIRNKLLGTEYTILGGYGKGYVFRCRKMSVDK